MMANTEDERKQALKNLFYHKFVHGLNGWPPKPGYRFIYSQGRHSGVVEVKNVDEDDENIKIYVQVILPMTGNILSYSFISLEANFEQSATIKKIQKNHWHLYLTSI